MAVEVELKLRVTDAATIEGVTAHCNQLAGKVQGAQLLRDEYFDTKTEHLRRCDFTVRLRIVAEKTYVALKGPRAVDSTGVYSRIELEFEVSDESSIRQQIERQGLHRVVVIEKQRSEYVLNDCRVAIDTVPFLGTFIEIEGIDRGYVEAARKLLGLHSVDPVVENYTELLEKHFLAIGRSVRPNLVATFDCPDMH
jgi:adenylate cyclase, class 2